MSHERLRALLSEYLDGELGAAERARLEEHLRGCSACRTELADLRRIVGHLRALPPVEPPPGLSDRVVARLQAGEGRPGWITRTGEQLARFTDSRWLAPAAATALGLGLLLAVQDFEVVLVLEDRAPEPRAATESVRSVANRPGPLLLDPALQAGLRRASRQGAGFRTPWLAHPGVAWSQDPETRPSPLRAVARAGAGPPMLALPTPVPSACSPVGEAGDVERWEPWPRAGPLGGGAQASFQR